MARSVLRCIPALYAPNIREGASVLKNSFMFPSELRLRAQHTTFAVFWPWFTDICVVLGPLTGSTVTFSTGWGFLRTLAGNCLKRGPSRAPSACSAGDWVPKPAGRCSCGASRGPISGIYGTFQTVSGRSSRKFGAGLRGVASCLWWKGQPASPTRGTKERGERLR
jgi:hypothetical protein